MSEQYLLPPTVASETLEHAIDAIWDDLQRDGTLASRGMTGDRQDHIRIEYASSGFGAIETAIIVAFAPVAATVARDIWREIILPRLKRRLGSDAITERQA